MRLQYILYQTLAIVTAMLLLCSCSRSYSGEFFSFPPRSKPHENNWTYLCQVTNWAPFGKNATERGNRKIQIIVNDKNKTKMLEDEFELVSASIRSKITWERIEKLSLDLYEVGNKFAEDDYNKKLIEEGPRHLITLNYIWDGKKYIKSNTEPLN
ncbi:MAG: hypothetical protein ACOZBW_08335 [Thermodesulfobacteriota bacterium]